MAVYKLYGKQHLKGVSRKSGNEYDFINCHLLIIDPNVEGQACKIVSVDPRVVDYDKLLVGQHYDFQVGFDGRVGSVTLAKV